MSLNFWPLKSNVDCNYRPSLGVKINSINMELNVKMIIQIYSCYICYVCIYVCTCIYIYTYIHFSTARIYPRQYMYNFKISDFKSPSIGILAYQY